MGGGAHGFGGRAALVPATPELLAAVAALPPATDEPDVDLSSLTAPDPDPTGPGAGGRRSMLRRVLSPFRGALAVGVALVVVDAATTLVGPLWVRHAIDDGVVAGSAGALWAACAGLLAVQAVSWGNARAMQLQTARTAERVLLGVRARTFAHLQRLSMDFYDREHGGRVITRMTTDVEALAQLLQQGLVTAVVSLLTCGGVMVVLCALDLRLAAAALAVLPVLAGATVAFQRASGRAYLLARERISVVNAALAEGLAGMDVTHAYAGEAGRAARFTALSTAYRDARLRSYTLVARFFPFLQLLSSVAKALTLGVAAVLIDDGTADGGRPRRLPALPRPVLHADPAAVDGLRPVGAGPGLARPPRRPAGRPVGHARAPPIR